MASNETNKYLMRRYDLSGGMDQSMNPFLMGDTRYTYLKNVVHDEYGSFSKDGGYSQYASTIASATNGVDLLFDYTDLSDTHTLLSVIKSNLYKATGDPIAWSQISASAFTEGNRCSAANFLDRCYIAEQATNVSYTDGSTLISISTDNGSATIKGKYLEVLNNSLYLGAVTDATYDTNQVVYTYPSTHVFYNANETDHDTYATTSQIITVDGDITGIKAYQGLLFIFTEEDMWYWNPATYETKQLAKIGCVAHDTIKEIDGILYWASREGIYRFTGSSLPTLISLPITNWVTNSIWRLINGSNWGEMNAGVLDGKYYLWIGTLTATMPGDSGAQSNVVIVYDTYRDSWFFLDNHPSNQWTTFINSSGDKRLLFGSNAAGKTYQRDFSYTHDTSAITSVIRTKYFDFENPESEKTLGDFYVAYRPEGETAKYITVKIAKNGDNSYTTYLDGSSTTKLPLTGTTTKEYQFERATIGGLRGRTISYEFSNADSGVNVTLLGYTQWYGYIQPNLNYTT